MPSEVLASKFTVKVNGSTLTQEWALALHEAIVDSSIHLPDMCTLEFRLERVALVDDTSVVEIGKEIEVSATGNKEAVDSQASIFKGYIAAIDVDFPEKELPRIIIRAYPKAYGLHLGTKFRSFVQVTDSDIVKKVAGEAGLSVKSDATTVVHKHVFQANQTNWEFLQERARLNGFVLVGRGSELKFVKPDSLQTSAVEVRYGEELIELSLTRTLAGQVAKTQVKGWDFLNKEVVVGEATTPTWKTTTLQSKLQSNLSDLGAAGASTLVPRAKVEQGEAERIAKARLDTYGSRHVHARGVCVGMPSLLSGGRIKLSGIGTRFSGEYTVTRVRHILNSAEGYSTEFMIGGMDSGTLANSVAPQSVNGRGPGMAPWTTLVPAIVTNNADNESKLGRVKVKYPWLDDSQESNWARVIMPGAGANRGLWMIPEVNDEVLVGFLHGDFDHPYVLGGLWNPRDMPPHPGQDSQKNGKTEIRGIKTRIGQELTFVDESGSEKILVQDKKGNSILLDGGNQKIIIETKGDFILKAAGKIKIEGMSVDVQATMGDAKLKAMNISAEGQAKVSLKAPMIDAVGSGPVTIKGTPVMLN